MLSDHAPMKMWHETRFRQQKNTNYFMLVSYIEVNDMRKEKNTTQMNRENDLTKKQIVMTSSNLENRNREKTDLPCLYLTLKSMAGKTSTNHVDV